MRLSHHLSWLLPVLFMAGCEPFDPWFDYAPDEKQLQHIGRMDWGTELGPTYAHSGVTIRFRCNCTGVDVAFEEDPDGANEAAATFIAEEVLDVPDAVIEPIDRAPGIQEGRISSDVQVAVFVGADYAG